jgi:hypothetical protein
MNTNASKLIVHGSILGAILGAMLFIGSAGAHDLTTGIIIRGIGPTKTCSAATVVPTGDQIDGRAHNLSVNCTAVTGDINNYATYTAGLPFTKFCVARILKIVQKSGTVKTDPIVGNPYHCLLNNIKVKDLVGVMTPKP